MSEKYKAEEGLRHRRPDAVVSDLLTTAISVAKKQVFKKALNEGQVCLVTDMNVKARTKWILLMAAFIDLSGGVLLAGAYPLMCANAPGAKPGLPVPGAFPAANFAFIGNQTGPPALDYAMTINLIPVSNQLGAVFSNYLAGTTSDKLGRKPVIEGCLLGGVLSYVLMFVAGAVLQNYWAFLFANFVNGLFSGIRGVISAYLQDIHEPVEFMTKVMPTMINFFLFGAMGGSLLGMVWVAVANANPASQNTHTALFGPCWIGVALSMGMTYVVHVYCPEPAKKAASDADSKEDKPPPPPMTPMAKKIITVILVAGTLDTFGDYGNRFARNTILTNRYPIARQAVVNYVLMASNIVSIYVGQQLVTWTIKKKGFMPATGMWAIGGNVASALVQFGLLIIVSMDTGLNAFFGYVAVWILSQVFGICSTLAAMFIFPAFVPPHRKGQMNGIRNSITSAVNVVCPIMLALIYQTGSLASAERLAATDRAAVIALAVCGGVSTLAFLCYLPLPGLLPKPPPPKKDADAPAHLNKDKSGKRLVGIEEAEITKPLAEYDGVTWAEWQSLDIATRLKIQQEREKAGMERILLPWGTWSEDRPIAGDILRKAPEEFRNMKSLQTSIVTGDDDTLNHIMQLRQRYLKGMAEDPAKQDKRAKARAAMGAWIADYLDDAGYDTWEIGPYMYKAMIMNAFPPVDALDEKMQEVTDAEKFRTDTLKFMRVMDLHLKTAETTSTATFTDLAAPTAMKIV